VTTVGIVVVALSVAALIVVFAAYVWAAREDGRAHGGKRRRRS
jgi:hypothetical protein